MGKIEISAAELSWDEKSKAWCETTTTDKTCLFAYTKAIFSGNDACRKISWWTHNVCMCVWVWVTEWVSIVQKCWFENETTVWLHNVYIYLRKQSLALFILTSSLFRHPLIWSLVSSMRNLWQKSKSRHGEWSQCRWPNTKIEKEPKIPLNRFLHRQYQPIWFRSDLNSVNAWSEHASN